MIHCQIIVLHHNPYLVHSVLDQFEQSIIDQQHKQCPNEQYQIFQSKAKLASFISHSSVLDGDVSRMIVDFSPPPLIIMKSHPKAIRKPDILLSFYDHYVDFNHHSLIQFASKIFKHCRFTKTCFINLFDEKEAELLVSEHDGAGTNEICKVYGFLTRLYSSAFDRSHHIHLFAKHHRDGIQYKEERDGDTTKAQKLPLLIQMKSMNVYDNIMMNGNQNQMLKNYHLTTSHLTSMKILSHLLSTIIVNNKIAPMSMFDVNGSLSLISKTRLRLNVVREIRSLIHPQSNQCIADLVDHILKTRQKYQSHSGLRVSYVNCN